MWSLQLREKLIFYDWPRELCTQIENYAHKSRIMHTNRELCTQIENYAHKSRIMHTNRELCTQIQPEVVFPYILLTRYPIGVLHSFLVQHLFFGKIAGDFQATKQLPYVSQPVFTDQKTHCMDINGFIS